jgi:hypothetical protein
VVAKSRKKLQAKPVVDFLTTAERIREALEQVDSGMSCQRVHSLAVIRGWEGKVLKPFHYRDLIGEEAVLVVASDPENQEVRRYGAELRGIGRRIPFWH